MTIEEEEQIYYANNPKKVCCVKCGAMHTIRQSWLQCMCGEVIIYEQNNEGKPKK